MDDSYECPAVVVYIINPFSYAAHDCDDLNRLAVIGLLRCYREVISMLPENMKNNIYLQVSIGKVQVLAKGCALIIGHHLMSKPTWKIGSRLPDDMGIS